MIFCIISSASILLFLILISLHLSAEGGDFGTGLIFGVFMVILLISKILMIYDISKKPEPNTIDVYRGKTTLKISYMDSIPQDTLVLWKNTTLI